MTETVRSAVAELEREITSVRSLVTDLRPYALDDLGTQAAIQDLAGRARDRGLEVEVSIDLAYEQGRAGEQHTSELETAMYRIVQEALTNAIRHGAAHHASVRIEEDHTSVRVTVHDDGEDFDTTAQPSGFGLLGMHERAELLRGTLEVTSSPGQGTTVKAEFPAQRRRHEQTA
jgi:two-component system, NarL family, sensor histidine kinase DevS